VRDSDDQEKEVTARLGPRERGDRLGPPVDSVVVGVPNPTLLQGRFLSLSIYIYIYLSGGKVTAARARVEFGEALFPVGGTLRHLL